MDGPESPKSEFIEPNDWTSVHRADVEFALIPLGDKPGELRVRNNGEHVEISTSHAVEVARALGMPIFRELRRD